MCSWFRQAATRPDLEDPLDVASGSLRGCGGIRVASDRHAILGGCVVKALHFHECETADISTFCSAEGRGRLRLSREDVCARAGAWSCNARRDMKIKHVTLSLAAALAISLI